MIALAPLFTYFTGFCQTLEILLFHDPCYLSHEPLNVPNLAYIVLPRAIGRTTVFINP